MCPLKPGKGFKQRRARLARAPFRRDVSGNYGGLKKVGNNSRSKGWRREWPGLKRELERAGITRCERCGSDYFLTPAHSLKRRHIMNRTEMREIALLCQPCHSDLELSGEAKMYPAVRAIIAARPDRLTEAA